MNKAVKAVFVAFRAAKSPQGKIDWRAAHIPEPVEKPEKDEAQLEREREKKRLKKERQKVRTSVACSSRGYGSI